VARPVPARNQTKKGRHGVRPRHDAPGNLINVRRSWRRGINVKIRPQDDQAFSVSARKDQKGVTVGESFGPKKTARRHVVINNGAQFKISREWEDEKLSGSINLSYDWERIHAMEHRRGVRRRGVIDGKAHSD